MCMAMGKNYLLENNVLTLSVKRGYNISKRFREAKI